MSSRTMHAFTVEYVLESHAAILVLYEHQEFWLPKSQIEWIGAADKGDELDVMVPEWLAEEKGMME